MLLCTSLPPRTRAHTHTHTHTHTHAHTDYRHNTRHESQSSRVSALWRRLMLPVDLLYTAFLFPAMLAVPGAVNTGWW